MGTMVAARHPQGDSRQLPHPPRATRPPAAMTRPAWCTHPASASCKPVSAGNRNSNSLNLQRPRGLRAEPGPVQQVRHAAQRVAHVEQPGDQRERRAGRRSCITSFPGWSGRDRVGGGRGLAGPRHRGTGFGVAGVSARPGQGGPLGQPGRQAGAGQGGKLVSPAAAGPGQRDRAECLIPLARRIGSRRGRGWRHAGVVSRVAGFWAPPGLRCPGPGDRRPGWPVPCGPSGDAP